MGRRTRLEWRYQVLEIYMYASDYQMNKQTVQKMKARASLVLEDKLFHISLHSSPKYLDLLSLHLSRKHTSNGTYHN